VLQYYTEFVLVLQYYTEFVLVLQYYTEFVLVLQYYTEFVLVLQYYTEKWYYIIKLNICTTISYWILYYSIILNLY